MTSEMSPWTQGLHHLGLTVDDLRAAHDFFTGALGFKTVGKNEDYPAVFVTDGVTMITLWQAEDPATAIKFDRRRNLGLHHAAFKVETARLRALYDIVTAWPGVEIDSAVSDVAPGRDASHFLIRMPGGPRLEFLASPKVAD